MASKTLNGKERPKNMIDPDDAVMLLIDHQSGLFQTVKDMEVTVLRANVVTLAKVATLAKIPVITTASVPQGPNGPLIPEIHKYAPHAKYVARRGQINAWDNPDFVKAVEETKRRTLIIAGTITSVCWAFPSISTRVTKYSPWLMHREPIRKWRRKSRLRDWCKLERYQSILPLCVRKSSRPGAAQTQRNGLKPMRVCFRHINC
jgi:hypothetical protein